ncbi:MAG: DUF1080 domain-containing protein [Ferruginibacter sp.]
MKNKLSVMVVSLAILMSCNNAENTSAPGTANTDSTMNKKDSSTDGWVSLFDGNTTTGWHSYGKEKAGELWKIADGALYLDTSKKEGFQTSGGGDLVTDAEYGNFDLKLEWKIAPKGNSGIIFYTHEDTVKYKYTFYTGPEMQIVDNNGHPDGKIMKHKAGDLYDLISSSKESAKPVGEWNEAEIIAKDGKLDLFLNGTNVVSTTMWDDNWKKLVAGSKFKEMPDFSTYKKGRIVLQDHGNMVWFRNIKIKEL